MLSTSFHSHCCNLAKQRIPFLHTVKFKTAQKLNYHCVKGANLILNQSSPVIFFKRWIAAQKEYSVWGNFPPNLSWHSSKQGLQGGSIGRTSDSRFNDLRFKPRQKHKKTVWVFLSQECYADLLSVCPTPRHMHNDHVNTLKIL